MAAKYLAAAMKMASAENWRYLSLSVKP